MILAVVAAALCCLLVMMTSGANASGTCGAEGDNLTWTFDSSTGKLIISGTGEMEDYNSNSSVPWDSYRNLIKTVEIADSVTSIGNWAFDNCNSLTSIEIPSSVTRIGHGLLNGCTSLESITVAERNHVYHSAGNCLIETVSKTLIAGCKNSVIPTDGSVTSIGYDAFDGCSSLTGIEIPSSVTSIEYGSFNGCSSLTSITVDDSNPSYRSIDGILFSKDQTTLVCYPAGKTETSYTIPDGVTSIGDRAFYGCSGLTSIEIPSSVTSIGSYAFDGCSSLTSVIFGENSKLTSIGIGAFQGCISLTSIEIPSSVASIGGNAFTNCMSLYIIYNNSNFALQIGSSSYGDIAQFAKLIINKNGNKTYRNDGAEYIDTEEGFLFKKQNGGYQLIAYFGAEETVTLPQDINGNSYEIYQMSGVRNVIIPEGMTSIGDRAFSWCRSLTSIEIPEGVTSIGWSAFSGCDSLTSVEIPSSVTSIEATAFSGCTGLESIAVDDSNPSYRSIDGILFSKDQTTLVCYPAGKTETIYTIPEGVTIIGGWAFYSCSGLTNIEIPSSVTSIGIRAFSGCDSLTSVEIPSSVTSIGNYAFDGCESLTNIDIPSSVTSIGYSAFGGCSSLTSITVAEGNHVYHSAGNCLIETASKTLVAGCKSSVIPADGSVTSIGDWVFYGCSGLTSIEIPSSVTSIGYFAFGYCNSLTSIEIPSSVTCIGDDAFGGCHSLTSIEIPSSVISIGNWAFSVCRSLTSITILSRDVEIYDSSYTIPTTATIYGYVGSTAQAYAEKYGNEFVALDESTISSGTCGAEGDNLTWTFDSSTGKLTISGTGEMAEYDSSSSVPWYSYRDSIKTVEIAEGVTSIGNYAFYYCRNLTNIDIPSSVTSIGDGAFGCWYDLTSIEIPSSVTSIGDSAFYDCRKLTSVTFGENSELTSIGTSAFSGCESLTSITFGENSQLTSIGNYAFSNCSSLTSIEIPSKVTNIGGEVFRNCSSLMDIAVDNENLSYESIDGILFSKDGTTIICYPMGKPNLSYTIPLNVTGIGDYAFSGCSNLTSVIVKKNVVNIKSTAFKECNNLIDIIVDRENSHYNSIDGVLFSRDGEKIICYPAGKTETTYTIPEGVTSIGESAFRGCSSLTSIEVPSSVTSIGDYAFAFCSHLEDITILSRDVEIYDSSNTIPTTATIYGYAGSTAQAYAEKYSNEFVALTEEEPYAPGDVNGDEIINSDDAIYLLKHTFLPEQYPLSGSGDMNGDGKVDSDDAVYLLKHTFLPEQYPLP